MSEPGVPGLVPLFTNPGDMIVFAHRTYHGAFPIIISRIADEGITSLYVKVDVWERFNLSHIFDLCNHAVRD